MWDVHSLQRIINSLRLPRDALAAIHLLCFQLLNALCLALLQLPGVHGSNRREGARDAAVTVRLQGYDLAGSNAREGDDVEVAGLGGGSGSGSIGGGKSRVDGDNVQHGTGGEEGAFEGLGVRRCGRDFDSVGLRVRG